MRKYQGELLWIKTNILYKGIVYCQKIYKNRQKNSEIFEHFLKIPYIVYMKISVKTIPFSHLKTAQKLDADSLTIQSGVDQIHEQYAEGKISLETAAAKIGAFLDSKGDINAPLAVLIALKNWRR